ncbi:rhamnogalacturonan lyase family protein [Lederbergia lenta]|uniref:Polysaccharide lyase family protein n=1 Tax=Lederbergia lenta TaxID=1467 RepID=A0A2X4WDD5_LEDLE|nr:fibronectin type III domain-containing protein [Lederbergia lenta]MEC2323108.1 fibronectin type III domain-containing protein [Lederbergia lenta]SQI62737.1 polysaccharide lyase family protein [Lederbergia lenta]
MSKRVVWGKRYFSSFLVCMLMISSFPFMGKAETASEIWRFDFGTEDSPVKKDYTQVHPGTGYTEEQGYGFADPSKVTAVAREGEDELKEDFAVFTETTFQVDLPNGDYAVKVIAGDSAEATEFGVKGNSIQKVQNTSVSRGEFVEREFDIAVINDQLAIQLTGDHSKINAMEIKALPERSATDDPAVYIVSDSTAQTFDPYWKPEAGWGQMLPKFFDEKVKINNHAIGGRSTKTFYNEGRLDTVLREIKPNDYLLIQFGHNDATVSVPDRYTPVEDYKEYLKTYVNGTRQRGAIPILITPVNRRDFNKDTGKFNVSFPEYKQAAEEVAKDLDVLLVDFNSLSREYFDQIGPEGTRSVFLHADPGIYEAYPNGIADDTHFQEYGAIQVAGILASAIAELNTPLANYVVDGGQAGEVPAIPKNIVVSNIGNAGASLSWEPSEGADIYRIYRKLAEEKEYQLVNTSTVPQLNLSGMEEGKTYDIVITALNGKGESERSEAVQIFTKTAVWKFDFGQEQNGGKSPVAKGYTEVNLSTLYTEELGYGIVDNKGMIARDRGDGGDLLRDWLGYFDVGWDFQVDLPNGLYAAKVHVADFLGSARTNVAIEGQDYGAVNAPKNGSIERVISDISITDGQMNIHFGGSTGIANGLEITPIFQAPGGLKLDEKNVDPTSPSVKISWDAADDAKHYRVYRKVVGSNEAEQIAETSDPTFTDTKVGVGVVYEYTVTMVNQNGKETVHSLPLVVEMVDSEQTVLDAPENLKELSVHKNDVTITWDAVEGALSYNVYRATKADGEFHLIGQTDKEKYTDTSVLTTTPYYYKVAAVNAGGVSKQSKALKTSVPTILKKQMEDLDRGPVAVKTDDGVYVSWRMLGTDPKNIAFHVYRDGKKISEKEITTSTNYLDKGGKVDSVYEISTIIDGKEQKQKEKITILENNFFDIPLQKPADGVTPLGDPYTYRANDVSVGDLDGDGNYDLVVKWDPSNAKDNSQSGYTGNVYVDGYKMDGTLLWRIDLGVNIRAGAHYTQFLTYDFDGDGHAEIVMKTADGTKDGQGKVIGRADADHRNSGGYILQGDEYLTIFDGKTGAAIDTVDYDPPRGKVDDWGDGYGNRVDRFLAGVAYLDGETPSIVMTRGYYTRSVLVAYDFTEGKLKKRWKFDSNDKGNGAYAGQGYHSLSVADVDGDQKDEIIFGQAVIDDDGSGLYSTGLGHGDALHVGDFIPDREGLEVFSVQENKSAEYGYVMRDAETGEILWGEHTGQDTGRGLVADIDPTHDGAEAWAINGAWNSQAGGLHAADGKKIADNIPSSNFAIWWDGDLLRELLDHDFDEELGAGVGKIDKWDYENKKLVNLLTAEGTLSNNHTKGTPALQADLFGDWREEVIWRTEDSSALRVFTTTDVTDHKIFTLMHDPQYRVAIAWQNVAYNQPPHPSFFIGAGMEEPPMPNIEVVKVDKEDPDPELDVSELESLLKEAKSIKNEGKYTEFTFTALQHAILIAEKALGEVETEDELKAAVAALQSAMDGLLTLEAFNTSYMLSTLETYQGDLAEKDYRTLNTHLTAVGQFEKKEAAEKIIKHMESLKKLLDHQLENKLIPQELYEMLKADTNSLIQKWDGK